MLTSRGTLPRASRWNNAARRAGTGGRRCLLFILILTAGALAPGQAQSGPEPTEVRQLVLTEGPSTGRGVPAMPPNAWERVSASYDYLGLSVRVHLVLEPPLPAEGFADAGCPQVPARQLVIRDRRYLLLELAPLRQLMVDLPAVISDPCVLLSAWILGFRQFSELFPDGRIEFPAIVPLPD